jgi:hypothetical protein
MTVNKILTLGLLTLLLIAPTLADIRDFILSSID